MESKAQLRKRMRDLRDQIPEPLRREKSRMIAERICASPWYVAGSCFFVYAATRSEVDLTWFCERAWADGKRLFFPKVHDKQMEFYRAADFGQLHKGAFGVMEPDPEVCPEASQEDAACAVILVPGIAFSGEGFRIGYGGGYYDRYLERRTGLYPVGICFDKQLIREFEPQAHDRRMREMITEESRIVI